MPNKPLCFDGYCGLGGWAKGFLAEGYEVIGFDLERHDYGNGGYPGQLVIQDCLTLHGSQFKDATCLVFSPPCQEFSYMAMPFSRGKQIAKALRGQGEFPEGYTGSRTIPQLTALFDACFRIQREAIQATRKLCDLCWGSCTEKFGNHMAFVRDFPCVRCDGKGYTTRYIPMIVENVKGAQPWVGRAKAHFRSFYLYGDVESVGGAIVIKRHAPKFGETLRPGSGQKIVGYSDPRRNGGRAVHLTSQAENNAGTKGFAKRFEDTPMARLGSKSSARKAASAQIAEIPFELSSWLARQLKPAR